MKTQLISPLLAAATLVAAGTRISCAQTAPTAPLSTAPLPVRRLQIRADRLGPRISPTLHGLMTEEINYSYDGGLYAELVRNRAFKDDPQTPVHWSLVADAVFPSGRIAGAFPPPSAEGSIRLDPGQPVPGTALTVSLRLDAAKMGPSGRVGVANEGYWGIPVRPKTRYRASFFAKSDGKNTAPLTVSIESNDGTRTFASAKTGKLSAGWQQFNLTLATGAVAASKTNRLVIASRAPGTIWLNQVSLFPPTYRDRPNGLRPDLMEKMAAMHPTFLRFPGGNYLEGPSVADRFDWKKTIGPIQNRPGHLGPWSYRSSDGMGLPEFLGWCEDLNVEPVLAVFAGYATNGETVTGAALRPFVQDALDEIEYVTGDKTTYWGARRIADGHPKPLPLRYLEIGNEDWFDKSGSYDGRFTQFYDAIRARYPKLQLIATARVTGRVPDLMDDHLYASPLALARASRNYDQTPRTGPKIFVGEWASQDVDSPWLSPGTKGPTPSLNAALGDAAYMTGLERNSDVVLMQCYAPLFVNVNPGGRQWAVNLIGYDALGSFNSPSYYAQAMFAKYRGDSVVPTELQAAPAPATAASAGKVGVGTWNTQAEFKEIRVTQNGASNGGQMLYPTTGNEPAPQWEFQNGQWGQNGGVVSQTGNATRSLAWIGDAGWGDMTYEVQARKTGGAEGFLIPFHVRGANDLVWLNLGGWGNTLHGLEKASGGQQVMLGQRVAGRIETGRWYRIRIETSGTAIRAFLDDELILQAQDAVPVEETIYTTASRDAKNGDLLLKVVNTGAQAQALQLDFVGLTQIGSTATGEILTGAPGDVNSLETPFKVAPQPLLIRGTARGFEHAFPGHSISVLRFKTKQGISTSPEGRIEK